MRISDWNSDVCSSDLLAASTSATIMFTVTGFQKDGKDIYEGLEIVDSLNRVGRTVAHTPVRNLCTLASFEARMPFDSVAEWAEVGSLSSDERRVGKEGVGQGRSWWTRHKSKKK